ncbi:hypothetical protein ACFORL_08905 [Legionella dresdenensis]|uniref:Uncharacterized protein n=1 Tax=Legionella dresdenensis TaxID=450200 RepID=A0ABV8CFV3_9GAMM
MCKLYFWFAPTSLSSLPLLILDDHFKPVQNFSGIYAFILYQNSFQKETKLALQPFVDYYSNHSGLSQLFLTFKKNYLKKYTEGEGSAFFEENNIRKKIADMEKPVGGGQIIFCNNQVVCWDLKSRAYSCCESSPCNAHNPETLKAFVSSIGLPVNRYINLEAAELFDQRLNEYFDKQGKFVIRSEIQSEDLQQSTVTIEALANKISSSFGLSLLFELEKKEIKPSISIDCY